MSLNDGKHYLIKDFLANVSTESVEEGKKAVGADGISSLTRFGFKHLKFLIIYTALRCLCSEGSGLVPENLIEIAGYYARTKMGDVIRENEEELRAMLERLDKEQETAKIYKYLLLEEILKTPLA